MSVCDVDIVEIATEGGLVGRTRMKRDLDAAGLSRRVVVDVKVRGLVETMEERSRGWSVKVRVHVGVPVGISVRYTNRFEEVGLTP